MNTTQILNLTLSDSVKFHFNNCSHAVEIWKGIQENADIEALHHAYPYILDAVQDFLQTEGIQTPSLTTGFWIWFLTTNIYEEIQAYGWHKCHDDMCRAHAWEGNPDIAGVGMLVTYLLQAVLVSIYLFALITIQVSKISPGSKSQRLRGRYISRILPAIQHSTTQFLSASSVFAVAMLAAALFGSDKERQDSSPITWMLRFFMPLNSLLPVAVLQLAALDMLRRSKGRMFLWLLIEILTVWLLIRSWHSRNSQYEGQYPSDHELFCLEFKSFRVMSIFSWIVASLLIVGMNSYLYFSKTLCAFFNGQSERAQKQQWVFWAIPIIATGIMWAYVLWFVHVTIKIRNHSGKENKDTEWSFGQVLALATWVPFIVDFFYICWENPEKATDGRLMDPYHVIATVQTPQQSID
ncbi:hypothetical protein PtrEW7m1_009122 [Pyrenophora tritici-repentis]|nr:hypothetical protein PtrEW7m1_009122 [Pyrenophora tritici-repentis]PWO25375.1 hypothetical protein PtrARCrB10_06106 [Pyrenophora tritici-repentis]